MAEPLTERELIDAYRGATRSPEEALVGASEVCRILGLHRNTVKRLPSAELPYVRVNKRGDRRYRPEDIRAYLAARRVE